VTGQAGLRRFIGPPGQPRRPPPSEPQPSQSEPGPAAGGEQPDAAEERCEFCATGIPATHGHVADLEQSSLMCACRACYLLFTHPGASTPGPSADQGVVGGRYRAVPDRYLRDPSRPVSAAEWDELQIPVGLAFFLNRSQTGELGCFYPSPAGATECAMDLPAWERLAATHPLLAEAEPDVEAVLICSASPGGPGGRPTGSTDPAAEPDIEYYIVPIDACYELAGRMRMLWRGFDGGSEAHRSIDEFLASVRERAKDVTRQDARHG
jgi:hypothetical protein